MKTKNAFTMTEIIIVIALLGVIAVISIPTLLISTNKSTYVAGLKRGYLMIKTATQELILDNGGSAIGIAGTPSGIADEDVLIDKYCKKLNCIKKCYTADDHNNCWKFPVKSLDEKTSWNEISNLLGSSPVYAVSGGQVPEMEGETPPSSYAVLANGMAMALKFDYAGCNSNMVMVPNPLPHVYYLSNMVIPTTAKGCGKVYLDVNGFKPPNRVGRDIFKFYIYNAGLTASGTALTPSEKNYNTSCNPAIVSTNSGAGCAGRVLTEGSMNY